MFVYKEVYMCMPSRIRFSHKALRPRGASLSSRSRMHVHCPLSRNASKKQVLLHRLFKVREQNNLYFSVAHSISALLSKTHGYCVGPHYFSYLSKYQTILVQQEPDVV